MRGVEKFNVIREGRFQIAEFRFENLITIPNTESEPLTYRLVKSLLIL